MINIIGLIVSFIYLFFVIFAASLVSKTHSEISRKIIHIGVSNWWIIVIFLFDNVYYACIGPALFIVINYISYKKNLIKWMERQDKKSLGTVYYAISCLILTILSFVVFKNKLYSGIGLLTMGYGDGLAAIIGCKFKSKEFKIWGNKKTVLGTITMFIVTFIVITILSLCFGQFNILSVLILSLLATLIEALSPFGIDNLTVPIITALVAFYII